MTENKSPLTVKIREMREEDIDGVLAIDRKIVGDNRALTYTETPTSYLGGELDVSTVAEVGGKIVGFLFGRIVDSPQGRADTALLELIGVDPDYRRRGIGSRLVQVFVESCNQKGVDSVRMMVSWYDWWLLSFLRSQGFSRGEMAEFVRLIER
ncbi:MAG: GNAT family N-acetyltransferase [Chloroflexi bacterium]|nr:GNAT family N-acetyltransferase [Chloroflexota bacterium]